MTGFHHMRVRMVDGHVEAERLQQHILVEHQILRLLGVALAQRVRRFQPQTDVYHLDDVLQLARLLFDLCREKKCRRSYTVSMEISKGVKCVEPVHVNDGCVDA